MGGDTYQEETGLPTKPLDEENFPLEWKPGERGFERPDDK